MEIREELENIYKKYNLIIGVDEVGRGCLAGPVVSCAIIMKKDSKIEGVTDSKKLSKKIAKNKDGKFYIEYRLFDSKKDGTDAKKYR